MTISDSEQPPRIIVRDLSYQFPDGSTGLHDVSLDLPAGSRTLLMGANGAGKTTLLRLLSGTRLSPRDTISISARDPFADGLEGVAYLGVEWVLNPIVRTDIAVPVLLASIGGDAFPQRRDELVQILDIDLSWRMHAVSDGERRRVQLAMGLMRPFRCLLLDEVTVDLDLLSRKRVLDWLKRETETRGATIVYATHIMDNLSDWPTHLVHMSLGHVKKYGSAEAMYESEMGKTGADSGRLGALVLKWLEQDLAERGPRRHDRGGQGKTYQSYEGLGGYGLENKNRLTKGTA